ncbi:MAG: hypothetical protein ABJH05_00755 [Fulvivirga sp.]
MKRLEKVLVVLILLGAIGSLLRIDYSNYIFLVGCTVISMLYFFFSFALFNDVKIRNITKPGSFKSIGRVIGSIGLGIALSIVIIGIQFKFFVLVGSDNMLNIGSTFLTIIGIVATIILIARNRQQPDFYLRVFKRLVPALLIGVISYITPGEYIIDIRYSDNPKLAELIKQSLHEPYDKELFNKIQKEKEKENSK